MGRAAEDVTVREAVLLIVDGAGGKLENRTTVQKAAYFAGLAIGQDFGHQAHYYGPYSRVVERALANEAFAGDLDEEIRRFQSWSGPDVRQYTYSLTSQGMEEVAEIRKEHPDSSERIDMLMKRLGKLVPSLAQQPLSVAAKVHFIARHRGTVAANEIPGLAHGMGWTVSDDDVERAVEILTKLRLVSVSE